MRNNRAGQMNNQLKQVVSVDLDSTLLNTSHYGIGLTEELVTLAYYCQGTQIPFFVTTNRSKRLSYTNIKTAAFDAHSSESKDAESEIFAQTVSYAQDKLNALGLNVNFCTLLDAARFKRQHDNNADLDGITQIRDFETRMFAKKIFRSLNSVCDEKESVDFTREALDEEKGFPVDLHPHKHDHFRAIAMSIRQRQDFKAIPIQILHIDDDEKIINANNDKKVDYGSDVSVNVFHIDVSRNPRNKATACNLVLVNIAEMIGLKQEAKALLENHQWSNQYVKDFALVRFLMHTTPPSLMLFNLIKEFENKYSKEMSLNPAQISSWNNVKRQFSNNFLALPFYVRFGFELKYKWSNLDWKTKALTIFGIVLGGGAVIASIFATPSGLLSFLIPNAKLLFWGGVGINGATAFNLVYDLYSQKSVLSEPNNNIMSSEQFNGSPSPQAYMIMNSRGLRCEGHDSMVSPAPSSLPIPANDAQRPSAQASLSQANQPHSPSPRG